LVRAEPEDDLWLLSIDALGSTAWSQIINVPIAGFSLDDRGEIFAWFLDADTAKTKLGVWMLSGRQR